MKQIKNILLLLIPIIVLVSCEQTNLPADLLDDNAGMDKLTEYIYSHYPKLKEEGIEVMEFDRHASIHPQRDELSSTLSLTIVKGDDKDRMVEYTLSNDGRLNNKLLDISVGDIINQKLSNSYDTYKPYLFPYKDIDLNTLREINKKAIEEFKKETNAESAYCANISIEREENQKPIVKILASQRKFSSSITRVYTYTLDGKKIK
ncbi:hypothetical protein [Riemerella columbina]|uniref:hypothetical protein n=1 Tax=Riemerella columbina TaxID=103810 RepID=UPI0003828305|nr:hypothetical protein [Riemerella columbina]